jgi:hypothetical protein
MVKVPLSHGQTQEYIPCPAFKSKFNLTRQPLGKTQSEETNALSVVVHLTDGNTYDMPFI